MNLTGVVLIPVIWIILTCCRFSPQKISFLMSLSIIQATGIGRTHGAPYRGYGYVPLRFGGGGGLGTSLGEWEHNNNCGGSVMAPKLNELAYAPELISRHL